MHEYQPTPPHARFHMYARTIRDLVCECTHVAIMSHGQRETSRSYMKWQTACRRKLADGDVLGGQQPESTGSQAWRGHERVHEYQPTHRLTLSLSHVCACNR